MASSPEDGARVDSSPAAVTLTFDESVRLVPGAAQVISMTGDRADSGSAQLSTDGTTVVIPLKPHVPQGSYAATWRVVSADTHVVSGSISFGIGQDAGAPAVAPADRSGSLTRTADIAGGVVDVGLVLCAGLALVCRILWPWALGLVRIRMLIGCGWVIIGLATVTQFLMQGPEALNLGWSAAFSTDALNETLSSRTGVVLLVRVVLIAMLGIALRRPQRGWTGVVAACTAGVTVTVVICGHAGAGEQMWLATPVTAAHVVAMTVWLGGLVALLVAVLPSGRTDNLRRWSSTAFACISVLILSGEYQAWRQVQPVEALWSTGYGITLTVKLSLVTVMLAVAYIGQRRLDPKVLRRTVPAEMVLGLAVLVATTALISQAPARTTFGPPVSLTAPLDSRSARIHIDTTRRGPTSISVTALNPQGRPTAAEAVSGTLSSDDAGVAALKVKFEPTAGGEWRSTYAVVPLPGSWTLNLTVEFSTSDAVVTSAAFRVW
ncbi:copper resistance CopC/CopD family protein [Mycolicibacterium komossense]|uniref:copper resistance CopC/CopD family protein n=1 Tax=Mycolicibacterium komossense TaxID=1779 RepID=UPI0021F3A50E|nr:copper resistance protein CopC/CopD [Mycolicibacterium komossense]